MNGHHPLQTDSQQPTAQRRKREKKSRFKQVWKWMLFVVEAIGIAVVYFGLSDIADQIFSINQAIQENTEAIKAQTHILSDLKQDIQHLIITIKDSVNNILHSI